MFCYLNGYFIKIVQNNRARFSSQAEYSVTQSILQTDIGKRMKTITDFYCHQTRNTSGVEDALIFGSLISY